MPKKPSADELEAAIEEHTARIGRGPSWAQWPEHIHAALKRIIERNDDPEDKVQVSAAGAKKILKDLYDFGTSENTLRNYAKQHLNRKTWAEP